MRFPAPLIPATLIRRYKRFLADALLPSGEEITAHVANPGAMTGLARPGARVWLSKSNDPKRKLPYAWELVEADFGAGPELVGVNTALPNRLIHAALAAGGIAECAGYAGIRREVKYGKNSRVDFVLDCPRRGPCYVEVKNVHLMREPGLAEFPDSVTARGARHMRELAEVVDAGNRAIMLFLIQIGSATRFAPAGDIDPAYAGALAGARARGGRGARLHLRADDRRDRSGPARTDYRSLVTRIARGPQSLRHQAQLSSICEISGDNPRAARKS